MEQEIIKLTRPYIQKVEESKRYDHKINELKHKRESLKEIDSLDLTLQQYIELEHASSFIHYLTKKRTESGRIRANEDTIFNKMGQAIMLEMNKDTELKSFARPLIDSVLGGSNSNVGKLQEDYEKVFKVALNRILDVVNPLIEEYIAALKHNNPNGNYLKIFENNLPKPLTPYIIERWEEYQNEKRKLQQKTYPVPNLFLKLK